MSDQHGPVLLVFTGCIMIDLLMASYSTIAGSWLESSRPSTTADQEVKLLSVTTKSQTFWPLIANNKEVNQQ